jgi:hypothetical protein
MTETRRPTPDEVEAAKALVPKIADAVEGIDCQAMYELAKHLEEDEATHNLAELCTEIGILRDLYNGYQAGDRIGNWEEAGPQIWMLHGVVKAAAGNILVIETGPDNDPDPLQPSDGDACTVWFPDDGGDEMFIANGGER